MSETSMFVEHIFVEGDDTFISCSCAVSVERDGYWVRVETDPYEGSAMVTLPCAEKVYEALGRAIAHARSIRAAPVNDP